MLCQGNFKPCDLLPEAPGCRSSRHRGNPACPDDVLVKRSAHTVVGGLGPLPGEGEFPAPLSFGPTGNPRFVLTRPMVEISLGDAFFPSS